MKKLVIAAAALAGLASASLSNAAGTIQFDRDGAGGTAAIPVNVFDWAPGNALAIAALSTTPASDGTRTFQVVSQGALSVFLGPTGSTLPVGQLTFQASFYEKATGLGTAAATFQLGAGASSFTVYYNPTATANDVAGTGYSDGIPILTGTLKTLSGNFVDNSILFGDSCGTSGTGTTCGLLDRLNGDDQNGVRTHSGNGSTTIEVDVDPTTLNRSFFITDVSSLVIDLQDTTNNAIPFSQANPSDKVFGFTPVYSLVSDGTKVNGAPCTLGGATEATGAPTQAQCDIHLQTDASTSFNPADVPEPSSLAIVGLALGLLGFSWRKKKGM